MDKNDIANDLYDLKDFHGDLVSMIMAVSMMEMKYKKTPAGSSLATGCQSLRSAAVDLLGAAEQMEGMANG